MLEVRVDAGGSLTSLRFIHADLSSSLQPYGNDRQLISTGTLSSCIAAAIVKTAIYRTCSPKWSRPPGSSPPSVLRPLQLFCWSHEWRVFLSPAEPDSSGVY
jgi:hypothetical protein